MNCQEHARAEDERLAVALGRYCSVGLCKKHLVEVHRPPAKPPYTCLRQPERAFDTLATGSRGSRCQVPHRAA